MLSDPAHSRGFGEIRFLSQKRGKVRIGLRHIVNARKVRRVFQSREDGIGDLAPRNFLFAVAMRNVARPETHVLAIGSTYCSQKDHGMPAFATADLIAPENFHEIAGLSLSKISEIATEIQFVKQTRRARAVGVPPSPNALPVVLFPNHELIQRREVELELSPIAQLLDCFNENDISRPRTKTRIRRSRDDEKLTRFKMGGRAQLNCGEVRHGI